MKSPEEIMKVVRKILVDVLAVDEADIQPSSRFFADLGGESIDALDLQFNCEKLFGVAIAFQELAPSGVPLDADGKLPAAAVAELKTKLPYIDFTGFDEDPRPECLFDLFTVDAIVRAVCGALEAKKTNAANA